MIVASSSEIFRRGSADLWIDACVIAFLCLYGTLRDRATIAICKIVTHNNIADICALRALVGAGR